jgi:hypothetical protein
MSNFELLKLTDYCDPSIQYLCSYILQQSLKVPDILTYQNKHNMLLNFPRCLSIFLLQNSKSGNNALDIDAIYNLKLRKTSMVKTF